MEAVGDVKLTEALRTGDASAADELYRRHRAAVLAFARRLCDDPYLAEDLASEAFTRTFAVVRSGGGGPAQAWRPYLYTVVRNTAAAWATTSRRAVLTAEFADWADQNPPPDDDLPGTETIARAFRSLPERWQTVLWHTQVEDEPAQKVAEMLGTSPGNVAQLAFRAREGLRRAFLAECATASPSCRRYVEQLAAGVRRPNVRRTLALRRHLASCAACRKTAGELTDLNQRLRTAILPIALLPAVFKTTPSSTLPWLVPTAAGGTVAAATLAVTVVYLPADEPDTPAKAEPPAVATSLTRSPTPAVKRPTLTTKTGPVSGLRVRSNPNGWCAGAKGTAVITLKCSDARTAWKRKQASDGYQLVNVTSGRCLSRGTQFDPSSWDGRGMYTVVAAPCDGSTARVWSDARYSDHIPRLRNRAFGVLEARTRGAPTPLILIPIAYTNSMQQSFTLKATKG